MAKITLQIVGENSKALQSIEQVKKSIKSLQEKPVKIKVVAQGLDALVSKLKEATAEEIKAAEAAAKKANAEARKINAETRAAKSAAKLASLCSGVSPSSICVSAIPYTNGKLRLGTQLHRFLKVLP